METSWGKKGQRGHTRCLEHAEFWVAAITRELWGGAGAHLALEAQVDSSMWGFVVGWVVRKPGF